MLTEAAFRRLFRNWSDVNFYNPSALRAEASNTFPTSSEYVMPFTFSIRSWHLITLFSAPNVFILIGGCMLFRDLGLVKREHPRLFRI